MDLASSCAIQSFYHNWQHCACLVDHVRLSIHAMRMKATLGIRLVHDEVSKYYQSTSKVHAKVLQNLIVWYQRLMGDSAGLLLRQANGFFG